MAKAQDHPHFDVEQSHLDDTITVIDAYIEKNTPVYGRAGDQKTAHLVWNVQNELLQKAKDARQQLYFGRVDWEPETSELREQFYIGHTLFKDTNSKIQVFAWQDTLLGELYYQMHTDREKGKLLLKRTFGIDSDCLDTLVDDYVDESLSDELVKEEADYFLIDLLRQTRGQKLRDIVATLRKQQHRIITAPEEQILIVHGPPGSGKTEVALHRVSYMLYQYRISHANPKRVLILGPNRLFVSYTANVLLSLGERNVTQRAFDEWMNEFLQSDVNYESQHVSLEVLLDPLVDQETKFMRFRNARNKGSYQMAQLLEAYVDLLQAEQFAGKDNLVCNAFTPRGDPIEISRSAVQIQEMLQQRGMHRLPFNQRRNALEKYLEGLLLRELTQTLANQRGGTLSERMTEQVTSRIREQIHSYFEEWHNLNVSVAYRRLLRNSRLLQQAGERVFSLWDLELLMQDSPTALTPFRFSDLAALMYLKFLLDGISASLYDHIIIDEAQDMAPLQFKVLAAFSRQKHMTILGDLGQGIYPHHGVSNWANLVQEFPFNVEYIPQSYRSTQQIITFANRMLSRIGTPIEQQIQPIARSGQDPNLQAFSNQDEWAEATIKLVQQAKDAGWSSVAIIAKTITKCRQLAQALKKAGLVDVQLVDGTNTELNGQTVIIPPHLAKGLEFDVTILADADAQSYPADDFHARLLYVALTRAAHELHVNWVGVITPLLDESQTTLALNEAFAEALSFKPIKIADFARLNPQLTPSWCVERLAGSDKLYLLQNGQIDQSLLSVLLKPYLRNLRQTGEAALATLSPKARQSIQTQVNTLLHAPEYQMGIALSQLVYGLLRNQMRFFGLQIDKTDEGNPAEQISLLATFLQAIEQDAVFLTAGRWTTTRAVLEYVGKRFQKDSETALSLLIDYGIIETNNNQLRVLTNWIHGLLLVALGNEPEGWDRDLLRQLSAPPQLLSQTASTEAGVFYG